MTPSRPSSDAARAAVWTGILGAAKHIGEHAPVPIRERPVVVQIRQGNTDTPLYSIGTGLCELNVPQFMPSQHSVFAAEIAWPAAWHDAAARNDTDATPVLEDMVVPYVTALHAHAGATPCVLVGYSFHASMAFEIAHQLLEKGSQVEMLMLLDAPAEYLRRHEIAWKYMRETWMPGAGKRAESIASRLAISLSIVRWTLAEAGGSLKRRFIESALRDPGELTTKLDTLGRPIRWPLMKWLYDNSLRSYKLRRVYCRGVLFRADRSKDCPALNADHSLGWRDMFGKGLEIIQATGDHMTMMREHPHNENLARLLSDAVARHCAKSAPHASYVAGTRSPAVV
jgi:thioesterase domain-containing protein